MSPQQEHYSQEKNCLEEIRSIREYFGKKSTTKDNYQVIFNVLGLMLFYCPEKILSLVEATLKEATLRSILLYG